MKRTSAALLALFFVLTVCAASVLYFTTVRNTSVSPGDSGLYIIIDAGHGGMDGGTTAADGTLEKDINLSVAKKLESMLKACGFKTVMLRSADELIGDNSLSTIRARKVSDIKTRLEITQSYPDALLISIHQNHYSVEKYSGAQVFYSPNAPESKLLAESVQGSIVGNIQPENTRQIKAVGTNIYLLYNCTQPSIMVECGFMSNQAEAQKLKDSNYQSQMAFSIMNGIINYLE